MRASVVRPKTTRGDGNLNRPSRGVSAVPESSDPKPREGTETLMVGHGRARLSGSSDPKPREGTETGRRIAPGAGGAAVVRPKTPRGDGNPTMASKSAWVTDPGRQTQNPERGRKRISPATPQPRYCSMSSDPKPREGTETSTPSVPHTGPVLPVVRPKTTRGDGNLNRPSRGVSAVPESSDPKPREGTETTTTGSPPRLLTGIQDEHDGGVDGEDVWS
ncbi:Uncharacterised protein [Mycobacterium tuberculosis]|nr:Uncharacterised protein [Mycobacterium tuberculosis]